VKLASAGVVLVVLCCVRLFCLQIELEKGSKEGDRPVKG